MVFCGSGLIDALAVILEMGLLDHTGLLKQKQSVSVAYRKYLGEYAGQPCVWLAHKVCVTQEDIRDYSLQRQHLQPECGFCCRIATLRMNSWIMSFLLVVLAAI